MKLREKIVREAFAKKDINQMMSHLKAIALGSDDIAMLGTTQSMVWLKAGRLAMTTCILHKVFSTTKVAAMLGETEDYPSSARMLGG